MSTGIWGSRLARYAMAVLAAATFGAIWLTLVTSDAEAKATKPPKPVISELTVSPSTVPSAGTTTVTATVSGAELCTLASNKPVTALPVTSSCSGGSFSQAVNMPNEHSEKKAKNFKLKLTAAGKGGKVNALVEVTVSTRRYSDTPTAVEGISNATQLGVGAQQACALLSGGSVSCWGRGAEGQLLNGSSTYGNDSPVETLVTGATQVASGGYHSCVTLSSGHVECAGYDHNGQLGDGNAEVGAEPVEVAGLTGAVQVAAGYEQTCALLGNGHVECWGLGQSGELGNGHYLTSRTPVEVQGISDATQITLGADGLHACALLATAHVKCWGSGGSGQLGNGSAANSDVPVDVLGVSEATQVSAGTAHTCAVLSGGHVECWGDNSYGQLGDGSTTGSAVPVEVTGITDATGVAASTVHACALLATGHVKCWGSGGGDGRLGNGTVTDSYTPVEVLGVDEAVALGAGGSQSCALLVSASVACWGDNAEGQLGNGTLI
jgi:alpha-tubulin suppressor-like RCC1 family protein